MIRYIGPATWVGPSDAGGNCAADDPHGYFDFDIECWFDDLHVDPAGEPPAGEPWDAHLSKSKACGDGPGALRPHSALSAGYKYQPVSRSTPARASRHQRQQPSEKTKENHSVEGHVVKAIKNWDFKIST